MVNTASRDASSCALAGGGGGNGAMSVLLLLWRRTPVRHSPRCTACSCDMLLLYLLPHMGQHHLAPCKGMRARRRRRDHMVPAPSQLDSGVLRGDSRSTGRSSSRRRVGQRYAQGSPSSWALLCGTFAALAWRGFTRNGSGWRPPLPPPQKQPLSGSVPFAHAVCIRHRCVRTCACFSGGRGHKSPKAGRAPAAAIWASTSRVVTDISSAVLADSARHLALVARWFPRAVSAIAPRQPRRIPRPPQPHAMVLPLSP